jgi:hypothetical protein
MKRSKSKFLHASTKLRYLPGYRYPTNFENPFSNGNRGDFDLTASMFTEKPPVMLKIVPKAGYSTVQYRYLCIAHWRKFAHREKEKRKSPMVGKGSEIEIVSKFFQRSKQKPVLWIRIQIRIKLKGTRVP